MDEGRNLKAISPKISNDVVDGFYSRAKKAGALGAKVLGLWGNGYFLVYAENGSKSQVIESMGNKGLLVFRFCNSGIETWTAHLNHIYE